MYRLRIATEPRLSPDGKHAVVTLQTVAPGFDASAMQFHKSFHQRESDTKTYVGAT